LRGTSGYWAPLEGIGFDGYEIRHGETRLIAGAAGAPIPVLPDRSGWQHGATLALYVHGMFENPAVMRALFGRQTPTLEDTLDGLADFVEARIPESTLLSLLEQPPV
jgi:adenosylcobyric acid synthase